LKIFVVGPSWVGDMVMAQSLFIALRDLHPTAQIDVLAPAWSRPIIEAMPEVNRAIDMPLGHGVLDVKARRALGHSLRAEGYDWAITLPNSFKSALIPWFAQIPRRTAWKGEMRYGVVNDLRKLDKTVFSLMVHKYVGLAYDKGTTPDRFTCPAPNLVPAEDNIVKAMAKFCLDKQRKVLALCPGAEFGRAKKWPERHYAEIAKRHLAQGGQVWLFGSQNDVPACQTIVELAASNGDGDSGDTTDSNVVLLAGSTSLEEAVALMSQADLALANDSGLMHVAAALNVPTVGLFGSTSPDYTPPLSERSAVIKSDADCSPCFKRDCPYGHYKCLEEMAPDRVWSALQGL